MFFVNLLRLLVQFHWKRLVLNILRKMHSTDIRFGFYHGSLNVVEVIEGYNFFAKGIFKKKRIL